MRHLLNVCAMLRTLWNRRMRFSYAFYAITFCTVTVAAVLSIQWSITTEPTYDDADAVDPTTKMLNSIRGQLTKFVGQMWMEHKYNFLLNFLVLGLIYLILILLINRFWLATALFSAISITFAVANHIKLGLRNEPVLPSDLSFITGGNGAEIGSFIPSSSMPLVHTSITVVAVIAAACVLLQFLDRRNCFIPFSWRKPFGNAKTIAGNGLRLTALVMSVITLFSFTWTISVQGSWAYTLATHLGDAPQLWSAADDSRANGPTMNFVRLVHTKVMDKPEGYSKQTMEELADTYTKSSQTTNQTRTASLTDSTVIMVLSESFSDPARVPGITLTEDPIPNIRALKDATTSGLMLSPSIGGGTANIEYQALSGLNLALFDNSLQSPYQELVPKQKHAYTFNQIWNNAYGEDGSIAFHPYFKNMYLRDSDYKKFGFSKFLTLDSNPAVTHQEHADNNPYVSDAAAYQNVMDAVNASDSPQFIQLVTMQNHVPYSPWYPDNQFQDADVSELSDGEKASIDVYAKGISITDQATADFLGQLNELDKPVTVIFYGDHLPGIYYTAMADDNNATALHETDYFIWSNQASASANVKLDAASANYTSSNFFMSLATQHMNAKVSPYLEMLSENHAEIPAFSRLVSGNGSWGEGSRTYLDADGNVVPYKSLSTKAKKLLKDYELVQYDLTAGKGYLNDTDFFTVE